MGNIFDNGYELHKIKNINNMVAKADWDNIYVCYGYYNNSRDTNKRKCFNNIWKGLKLQFCCAFCTYTFFGNFFTFTKIKYV